MPQGPGNNDRPKDQQAEETIVDFSEFRAKKLEEKRRKTERIFFKQILGMYSVVGNEEMRAVELVDVSEEGCAFQVPFDPNDPWPKNMEQIPVRLYFSQDTYLQLHLEIMNSRPCIEEGRRYTRYGCKVDKSLTAYETYAQFVKFLTLYAQHAHKDKGKATVFYL